MCLCPYNVNHDGVITPVPCGRCPECRSRSISQWSFRLRQELKVSSAAHFVTFTYGIENIPITKTGLYTLLPKDMQDYWKRLRKRCSLGEQSVQPIKYFVCGEYGSKNKRPHYHAIIFNCLSKLAYDQAWSLHGKSLGRIYVGDVTPASIGYTLKYMCKRSVIDWREFNDAEDRVPEFRHMSKGLGKNYVTPGMIKWHNADLDRMYCNVDGKKISMPRYYKDRIYENDLRDTIAFRQHEHAVYKMLSKQEQMIDLYGDNWENKVTEQRIVAFDRMYKNANKNRNL